MHNERGNILFLILLAVVLFAALSYAVTSSMRGGGNNSSKENADLFASQLLQNMALMEQTITRAKLVDNVPEYNFDFYRGQSGGNTSTNTNCTTPACKIYSDNGGPVPYIIIPPEFTYPAGSNVRPYTNVAQVINIGTAAPDVLIVYNFVNQDLCEALNRVARASGVNIAVVDSIGGTNNVYSGGITSMPASTGVIGDSNTTLAGVKAACYNLDGAGGYRFHYVIMER